MTENPTRPLRCVSGVDAPEKKRNGAFRGRTEVVKKHKTKKVPLVPQNIGIFWGGKNVYNIKK